MFKLVNVFKREGNYLKVYRCFQSIENSRYYVQSVDFFQSPINVDALSNSNQQLLGRVLNLNLTLPAAIFYKYKAKIVQLSHLNKQFLTQ